MIEILYTGNTTFYNGICKLWSNQPNQVLISIQPIGNPKLFKIEGGLAVLNFKLYYHANLFNMGLRVDYISLWLS